MPFQKPTLDIILENLNLIFEDIDKVYGSKKIIESILQGNIYVGGVITFDNFFSNVIKFGTQSLYSHVTFCYPEENGACYVWGAENSKGLTIQKYYNDEDSLFIIKKLDLDRILDNVDFNQFSVVLDSIYGRNSFSRALQRYEIFKKEVKKLDKINFFKLLQVEAEIEKQMEEKRIVKEIDNKLLKLKEILGCEKDFVNKNTILKYEKNEDKFYKRLFFSWGIVKFLLANYGKKYDYLSIFTMYLLKPFLVNYDYLTKGTRKFFCSEFVSATFLYAGFYPFDFYGKYPDLVVPGDLMDPNLWIYDEKYLKVVRFFSKKDLKPVVIEGGCQEDNQMIIKKMSSRGYTEDDKFVFKNCYKVKKQIYELIAGMRKNKFLRTAFHILVLYLIFGLVFSLPWVVMFLIF